jgi:hypothetical protein
VLEPASTWVPSPLPAVATARGFVTQHEQPDHPGSFTSPGVSATRPISILPTIYPDELSVAITVENHITTNVHGTDFREFNAKIDELLSELRRSNEIAGDVRDKLVGEITAGMAILRAPKSDPKMVDLLLVQPLKYIEDKAAGPVIGAAALAALRPLASWSGSIRSAWPSKRPGA